MEEKTRGWLRDAGALERTTFTGMIAGEERLAALSDAAMFVLPSYSENFGIAVVEAAACGLPVVISDAVNIWHDIRAAGAGLVSACDVDAVAANMIALLEDPGRAREMGARGRRLAADRFSWDGVAAELEAAYRRVLSGAHPGREGEA